MKIGGFQISKKMLIIIIGIIAVIIISSKVSDYKKQKELEERNAAMLAQIPSTTTPQETQKPLSVDEQIQAQLVEKYGVAPDGFKWNYDGTLIPLSDETSTAEDVIYTFTRALSMLDFSTAERYSLDSSIVEAYQDYYGVTSQAINNDYANFLRKQFKCSLTSLETLGISDTAVFADGTMYCTLTVNVLNLTDKDFWLTDKDELFETMYIYRDTETDDAKLEQYLYDYLFGKYSDKEFPKKEYTVEVVVTKEGNGGWLVTNDKELLAKLMYENGVDVASYILSEFESWYIKESVERDNVR